MRAGLLILPLFPMVLAAALSSALASPGLAQDPATAVIPVTGDRLSGFVLPIEPIAGDFTMRATQAWQWKVDDTQRLVLRGDVAITLSGNTFRADEAVVWFNRLPSAKGVINQVALYFDRMSDPTQRAGIGPAGSDLLVTASVRGAITLRCPFVTEGPPPSAPIVARADRRLAEHLRRILGMPLPLVPPDRILPLPQIDQPAPTPQQVPEPGASPKLREDQLPSAVRLESDTSVSMFDPRGVVAFSGGAVEIDEATDHVVVDRRLVVDYLDEEAEGGPRRLTLTAERGVLYLAPGTVKQMRSSAQRLQADRVLGIYLEGDVVASDGTFTARGARVYYDVPGNRALTADAVLRTYVRDNRIPVVMRAEEMRQLSVDQYTAKKAVVSTSEFFVPHLSVGAKDVTITRAPGEPLPEQPPTPGARAASTGLASPIGGGARPPSSSQLASPQEDPFRFGGRGRGGGAASAGKGVLVEAQGLTARAGRVPFFYWPSATVEDGEVPVRGLAAGYNEQKGVILESDWDLLSLLNVSDRSKLDATLSLDGYTERGPGVGTAFQYDFLGSGSADLYGLYDSGIDETSSGLLVEPETEFRGMAVGEHRTILEDQWTLSLQYSWISDPTFITSWREVDFAERREYETSAYLLRQESNTAFTALARYDAVSFISNEWLLGSRAYTVRRFPQASYQRYGDVIFDSVTWSQEWRIGRLQILPTSGTPNSLGVPGAAFGLTGDQDIGGAFYADGFRTNPIGRFDTRQEFSVPFDLGPVRLVPYGVARFTGYYNEEFDAYSPEAEQYRGFASAGVRGSTQFQHVDSSVESRLLDVHRLRHILEPGFTAWYGWSNAPETAYPVYDQGVEGIGEAALVDLNVRSIWQTQRGGPGRWRSVDWLTVDLGGVLNTDEGADNVVVPTPRFYRWRPEYSHFGNHVYGTGVWQFSDALAFIGGGTYSLEEDTLARGSVGVDVTHSPDLRTYVEYRTIEAENSELLEVGMDYKLSKKYRVVLSPQIDLNGGEFRAAYFAIVRDFPDFWLTLNFGYDQITDEATFGASLRPVRY